jgi:hypothetical protein
MTAIIPASSQAAGAFFKDAPELPETAGFRSVPRFPNRQTPARHH